MPLRQHYGALSHDMIQLMLGFWKGRVLRVRPHGSSQDYRVSLYHHQRGRWIIMINTMNMNASGINNMLHAPPFQNIFTHRITLMLCGLWLFTAVTKPVDITTQRRYYNECYNTINDEDNHTLYPPCFVIYFITPSVLSLYHIHHLIRSTALPNVLALVSRNVLRNIIDVFCCDVECDFFKIFLRQH